MVVLFLSSFRRQACQSVRVCHGYGDPFSGISWLNFELHLFAKFPELVRSSSTGQAKRERGDAEVEKREPLLFSLLLFLLTKH